MGVIRSVLMPVVTLPSFKMIGRLEVGLHWSSDFAFNVFVCQVEPLVRSIFFGRKLILKVSTVPNQFNGSISKSAVNLEKIGRGQIFGLSRDTPHLQAR